MRSVLPLVAAAILTTSCGSPQHAAIKACEAFVTERLKAPSTYKQVASDAFIEVSGKQGWVTVEYDAANSFGVPLRDKQICTFDTPNGQWPTESELRHQATMAAISSEGSCCNDKADELAVTDEAAEEVEPVEAAVPVTPLPESRPEPKRKAVAMCFQDYCPCDPPQGGPDAGLCRQLRAGMDVDPELMSAAAMMRDARRQISEFEAEHGEF